MTSCMIDDTLSEKQNLWNGSMNFGGSEYLGRPSFAWRTVCVRAARTPQSLFEILWSILDQMHRRVV